MSGLRGRPGSARILVDTPQSTVTGLVRRQATSTQAVSHIVMETTASGQNVMLDAVLVSKEICFQLLADEKTAGLAANGLTC